MPKDEPTSQNKSHKKGKKKLKRIHEGIDQLADGLAGNSLQPESSRPNAKAAAKPPAPIIQAAVPQSTVTLNAMQEVSRCPFSRTSSLQHCKETTSVQAPCTIEQL